VTHMRMSHVIVMNTVVSHTHLNGSRHGTRASSWSSLTMVTYEIGYVSHMSRSRGTHMNESRHGTQASSWSSLTMVTYEIRYMSHMSRSRVTHLNESHHGTRAPPSETTPLASHTLPRLERKAWRIVRTRRYLRSWQGNRSPVPDCKVLPIYPHFTLLVWSSSNSVWLIGEQVLSLQHTATHIDLLQHTATHYNTLQHAASYCNILQHAATRCDTLQQTV
jgi:hypothetical protein